MRPTNYYSEHFDESRGDKEPQIQWIYHNYSGGDEVVNVVVWNAKGGRVVTEDGGLSPILHNSWSVSVQIRNDKKIGVEFTPIKNAHAYVVTTRPTRLPKND